MSAARLMGRTLSPPGILFALLGLASLLLPFLTLRANRIVAGEGAAPWDVAGPGTVGIAMLAIAGGLACGLFQSRHALRLAGSLACLAGLFTLLSSGSAHLLEGAGDLARVSPAAGFWCLFAVALLLMADGHDHMAGWLRDRPAPLYLPETGLAEFEDALNQRADDQVMLSDGVRDQAVRQAEELPEDHPLRARLLDP